jgi:hypothetical protein
VAPAVERHELAQRHGKAAVERTLLREVSKPAAMADTFDRAAPRSHYAGERLDERALAGAVRPDYGGVMVPAANAPVRFCRAP